MHTEVRAGAPVQLPTQQRRGVDRLVAGGWLPDWLIRIGIRRLLRERLRTEALPEPELSQALQAFVEDLKASPIAIDTAAANAQHYEVPTAFFQGYALVSA